MYYTKKAGFRQPCFIRSFHARHLLFDLKQETGRERDPIRTTCFLRKQETKGGQ